MAAREVGANLNPIRPSQAVGEANGFEEDQTERIPIDAFVKETGDRDTLPKTPFQINSILG